MCSPLNSERGNDAERPRSIVLADAAEFGAIIARVALAITGPPGSVAQKEAQGSPREAHSDAE
jgi:hypothetical protein